jgi:hypothetical protein
MLFSACRCGKNSDKKGSRRKILVSSVDNVADFCDAVKTKVADSHLRDIDPDDMKVFQNAAALEANALPLDVDSTISGGSPEDPLIVMVPPPVWFQLVGADCLPFNGSNVHNLPLSRRSSIVEFRKAIKAEYADSYLKDVAAPNLKVFRNKASLQEPLDPFHTLGELGKREDPLIVVVPPLVWFQLVGADRLPLGGSSVYALTLPRRSSICEFRKAVKANKLSYLDVEDLKVFENIAYLEADNALEVDDIIGELGESKNDPLIVLVPSTSKFFYLRFCST